MTGLKPKERRKARKRILGFVGAKKMSQIEVKNRGKQKRPSNNNERRRGKKQLNIFKVFGESLWKFFRSFVRSPAAAPQLHTWKLMEQERMKKITRN